MLGVGLHAKLSRLCDGTVVGSGNLVGSHYQQRVAHVGNGLRQQHLQKRVFLEESGCEVLQVFEQSVIRHRPVRGEVDAVFIASGSVGDITCLSAVRNDEKLKVFEERLLAVETFLL